PDPGRCCRRMASVSLALLAPDPELAIRFLASRVVPGFAQLLSVEDEQDQRDEEQYGLVEGAGDRKQANRRQPPDPARDSSVLHPDAHGASRPPDEGPYASEEGADEPKATSATV